MDKPDFMLYVMASEKVSNLLYLVDQTVSFLDEYEIKPEENVKTEVLKTISKLEKWARQ